MANKCPGELAEIFPCPIIITSNKPAVTSPHENLTSQTAQTAVPSMENHMQDLPGSISLAVDQSSCPDAAAGYRPCPFSECLWPADQSAIGKFNPVAFAGTSALKRKSISDAPYDKTSRRCMLTLDLVNGSLNKTAGINISESPGPSTTEAEIKINRSMGEVKSDFYSMSHNMDEDSDDAVYVSTCSEPASKGKTSKTSTPSDIKNQAKSSLLDGSGEVHFEPDGRKPSKSSDWVPTESVSKYITFWIRKPLDPQLRKKLVAECPRPTTPGKGCVTPELDSAIVQYLRKSGEDPRKGNDRLLKLCQDKLLDVFGPTAKIFDLIETSIESGTTVDAGVLRRLVKIAICFLGNANTALATERRRAILLMLDPRLAWMAGDEPGPSAKGMLFGENFVAKVFKYLKVFSTLGNTQRNIQAEVQKSSQRNKRGRNQFFPQRPVPQRPFSSYRKTSGKDIVKDIDGSLKLCQDKLLDVIGPLAKIFDLIEISIASGTTVHVKVLRRMVKIAICFLGNANAALATERRLAILLMLDPRLAWMAGDELGPSAKGMLFGESFVTKIFKYLKLFSSLANTQRNVQYIDMESSNEVTDRNRSGNQHETSVVSIPTCEIQE